MKQEAVSVSFSHERPPYAGCCKTSRIRVTSPIPHSLEHLDHGIHSDKIHGIAELNINIYYKT
jgi:hypothetical protein